MVTVKEACVLVWLTLGTIRQRVAEGKMPRIQGCGTWAASADAEASGIIDGAVDAVRTRWPAEVNTQGFDASDVPATTAS